MNSVIEEWRDVVGYDGLYKISNLGNLRRTERIIKRGGISLKLKEKFLTGHNTNGYKIVTLTKDKKKEKIFIHRLVANAFIPNPGNLPFVNHKDENPSNNEASNLEWCTHKYNVNYGTGIQRMVAKRKENMVNYKAVEQYSLDGEFIKEYPSILEASIQTSTRANNISMCCRNYRHLVSANGFQWRYKGSKKQIKSLVKRIYQFDKENNLINIYNSVIAAAKDTGIIRTSIFNCLAGLSKSAGGFLWEIEQ